MPEFNVKPSLYSVTFYSKNVTQFVTQSVENVPNKGKQQEKQNGTQDEKIGTQSKRLEEYRQKITEFIRNDNTITTEELAQKLDVVLEPLNVT